MRHSGCSLRIIQLRRRCIHSRLLKHPQRRLPFPFCTDIEVSSVLSSHDCSSIEAMYVMILSLSMGLCPREGLRSINGAVDVPVGVSRGPDLSDSAFSSSTCDCSNEGRTFFLHGFRQPTPYRFFADATCPRLLPLLLG